MTSLDRMMAAIRGGCSKPPVVIPYLQYYFPLVIDKITPFTEADLSSGSLEQIAEAHSSLHLFFDCDWIRVWENPPLRKVERKNETSNSSRTPAPAEELLERGRYAVASELVRRFGKEKFIYGRVGTPYTSFYGKLSIQQWLIRVVVDTEKFPTIRRFNPCKYYVSGVYLRNDYQKNVSSN